MAAYSRVYDSRHLQADCQELGSAETLRSVIEYGLPLPFYGSFVCDICVFYFTLHTVTCHPTEMTFPPLPQPKLVLD